MKILKRLALSTVLGVLLCGALTSHAEDADLARARSLLVAKDAPAAYALLAPLESERAGDPAFDQLLGSAALEAGKPTQAVFALERVVALQPDNFTAKAALARAYFALRETDAARKEFQALKTKTSDGEELKRVDQYLDAIEHLSLRDRFASQFFLEFALGWDSNINSATALTDVAVPALGNAVLTVNNRSAVKQDRFVSATGGLNFSTPLGGGLGLLGGLSVSKRFGVDQPDFGNGYLDAYLGVTKQIGKETFTAIAQANMFFLDDPTLRFEYRDAVGATFQWTHDYDANNQMTVYGQYASLSYPEQLGRDANRYILGLGYAHTFRGGDPLVYAGVYGGVEESKLGAFEYLGHNPIGLRLGGTKRISERMSLFLSGSAERRDYRGTDPLFNLDRGDLQLTGSLGLRINTVKGWVISPQLSYVNNRSNIPINQFDQTQVFVTARREF